jgi:hypothetical protein
MSQTVRDRASNLIMSWRNGKNRSSVDVMRIVFPYHDVDQAGHRKMQMQYRWFILKLLTRLELVYVLETIKDVLS